jgi:predicted DCC family thiol-disulfide oxidoreductase YuxK
MPELAVLYDGSCSICRASATRVRRFDTAQRIELLDLHDPTALQRFPQIDREAALRLMQAVDLRGRVYNGADAWARIGLLLPGWKVAAWLLFVPGIHWIAVKIYAWVARNRYRWNRTICDDGSCALHVPGAPSPRNPR